MKVHFTEKYAHATPGSHACSCVHFKRTLHYDDYECSEGSSDKKENKKV
uniref:Uncharacterized protein n=1 Tax=Anguilla anguilla TaxID=7936 RepID=A0A0E9TE21_ANGAN